MENFLRKSGPVQEVEYDFQNGRYTLDTAVPIIMYSTLPLLSDDPERLYDELADEVPGWPHGPVAGHYRHLFGWLAARFNKTSVVERSATSTMWFQQLRAAFPEARFLYLYRTGPDCAVSMSKHPGYRYVALLSEAARLVGAPGATHIDDAQLKLLPGWLGEIVSGRYDLNALMSSPVPVTWFGQHWSDQNVEAVTELLELPPHMWTFMSYDDLLADPGTQLREFAEFIDVEPEDTWIRYVTHKIDPSRVGGVGGLDPATRAALEGVCAPGTAALRSLHRARSS